MSEHDEFLDGDADQSKREASSISFPYMDFEVALAVAQAIYSRGGLSGCDLDELASELGHTLNGAFRAKTAAARIFGVIEKGGRNSVLLSDLGRRLLNQKTEKAARVEAFLNVPLYAKIFESYRGHRLPSARAMENEMTKWGVAPKQKERARQAFERSARQTGFFEDGDDRLVKPRVEPVQTANQQPEISDQPTDPTHRSEEVDRQSNANASGAPPPSSDRQSAHLDPFIQGLLKTLPDEGAASSKQKWQLKDRIKWLRTAAGVFDLIYADDSDGEIEIKLGS